MAVAPTVRNSTQTDPMDDFKINSDAPTEDLSPTMMIQKFLASQGKKPTSANVAEALRINSIDPGVIQGLRSDTAGGGTDPGASEASARSRSGGGSARGLPIPPIPPGQTGAKTEDPPLPTPPIPPAGASSAPPAPAATPPATPAATPSPVVSGPTGAPDVPVLDDMGRPMNNAATGGPQPDMIAQLIQRGMQLMGQGGASLVNRVGQPTPSLALPQIPAGNRATAAQPPPAPMVPPAVPGDPLRQPGVIPSPQPPPPIVSPPMPGSPAGASMQQPPAPPPGLLQQLMNNINKGGSAVNNAIGLSRPRTDPKTGRPLPY